MLEPFKKSSPQDYRRLTEHGATIVEMSIVLPIVLVFVLVVFDFARILSRQAFASNALRAAARHAATFESNCAAEADASLRKELAPFSMSDAVIGTVTAVKHNDVLHFTRPVSGAVESIDTLSVEATIQVTCILCPVLRGMMVVAQGDSGLLNYRATAVVPIEVPNGCNT